MSKTDEESVRMKGLKLSNDIFNMPAAGTIKPKGNTMKNEVVNNIKDETIDNSKLIVGRVVYTNVVGFVSPYLPQVTWYEKLFVSKEKREVATMIAVYFLLHLVKSKYSHYGFEALTAYINHELQTRLMNGMRLAELHKLVALPVKVK